MVDRGEPSRRSARPRGEIRRIAGDGDPPDLSREIHLICREQIHLICRREIHLICGEEIRLICREQIRLICG
jgi:hypothetical protein